MSASDRRHGGWPSGERRQGGDRRAGGDRRQDTKPGGHGTRAAEQRQRQRRSGKERRDESDWRAVVLESGEAATPTSDQALLDAARRARDFAQAPYSGFKVGAALETADGRVVTGCNIENASYGLTLCAERVALVKALSDGHTIFTRIAVVADTDDPTPPCGPCRQLLWEYCGDIDIVLGNLKQPTARHRLSALLPLPFDRRLLGG